MPRDARAMTGAPYSGEQVNEQVQTLADGTHITRKSAATKVYRDSAGRMRTERPLAPGLALAGRLRDSPTIIEITDPVAQVKYTLDPINKIAHRQQLAAARPNPIRTETRNGVLQGVAGGGGGGAGSVILSAGVPSERVRPEFATEELGTRTIEGVLAAGTRTTTTWPVDSQGNDRPISVVGETWTSVDLKVMILSTSNDPRSGENTQKLVNISQAEPDASLFQPPPEYSVVDESGAFDIKWGSQQ